MRVELMTMEERKKKVCCVCKTDKSVKYKSKDGKVYCNKCVVDAWRKGE